MTVVLEDRVCSALGELEAADPRIRLRKPLPSFEDADRPCEVDLWLPADAVRQADELLARAGFHRFRAAGHATHRFYLAADGGQWVKLDAKLTHDTRERADRRAWPDRVSAVRTALARRRPLALRRQGPVVALVGPDGAGKGTVIDRLVATMPVATTVVRVAPTSRPVAGVADRTSPSPDAVPPRRGVGGGWRARLEALLVIKLLAWKTRRLAAAYLAAWQGRVVLCDRHPVEALAIDPRRTRTARAVERTVVRRLLPWPDRVIVLDASAQTMYARKGEHDVALLERWRAAFRKELAGPTTVVVDTEGAVEDARRAAGEVVWEALAQRRRW